MSKRPFGYISGKGVQYVAPDTESVNLGSRSFFCAFSAKCPICGQVASIRWDVRPLMSPSKYDVKSCSHFLGCHEEGESANTTYKIAFSESIIGVVMDADIVPFGYLLKDVGSKYGNDGCDCIWKRMKHNVKDEDTNNYPWVRLVSPAEACRTGINYRSKRPEYHGKQRIKGWTFNRFEVLSKIEKKEKR